MNPKKLIATGFSGLKPKMTMSKTIKEYKLPEKPLLQGLRPMEKKDCVQVQLLLEKYLSKFILAPKLSLEEVEHWLLPRDNVVNSYVVEVCQLFI